MNLWKEKIGRIKMDFVEGGWIAGISVIEKQPSSTDNRNTSLSTRVEYIELAAVQRFLKN